MSIIQIFKSNFANCRGYLPDFIFDIERSVKHAALDGSTYFVRDKTSLTIVFNEIYYFRLFKKNKFNI